MTNSNFLITIPIHYHEMRLWESIKWSLKRKYFDLLSNSLNSLFKEMYRDQFGEFVFGYWGLKGYLNYCQCLNVMCLSRVNDVIISIIDTNISNSSVLQVLVLNWTDKCNIIQTNHFFKTSLFKGHQSIQGMWNLAPGKYSHHLFICYLCWRNTSIQGKGTLFFSQGTP